MKCPCIDCICIPICKHKTYSQMIGDCSTVINDLYYDGDPKTSQRKRWYSKLMTQIEDHIKPSNWKLHIDNAGFAYIMIKTIESNISGELTMLEGAIFNADLSV